VIGWRHVSAATAALAAGTRASLANVRSDETYVCTVLKRYLRGFAFNDSDLRAFARDYKGEIHIGRTQRLAGLLGALYFSNLLRQGWNPARFARISHDERMMFSAFLLSTDFFDSGRAPAAPLVYRGYNGPPICNPLAQLRDR
jgi:hypothetical protein